MNYEQLQLPWPGEVYDEPREPNCHCGQPGYTWGVCKQHWDEEWEAGHGSI